MTTTHIMSDETGQQILAQLTAISQALDDGALTNQQISTVLSDGTPTGAGFLDGGGLKAFFDGLKTKFAAIAHNHSGDALTPASVTATGKVKAATIEDSGGTLAALRKSVSLLEKSYTVNGVTFEFRKYGRVVCVISSGTPTSAITTTGYAGSETLDARLKPAGTFIVHITAIAGVTMQVNIGQADGNFTYGIASSTIGTSSNIRCCFSYISEA